MLDEKIEYVEKREDTHKVKSWETLWAIVKNRYGLENDTKITDIVKKVVDYQEDGKMATRLWKNTDSKNKWDNIRPWDNIKLPPELESLS
jgi:nucleoid-associated protein YgaU